MPNASCSSSDLTPWALSQAQIPSSFTCAFLLCSTPVSLTHFLRLLFASIRSYMFQRRKLYIQCIMSSNTRGYREERSSVRTLPARLQRFLTTAAVPMTAQEPMWCFNFCTPTDVLINSMSVCFPLNVFQGCVVVGSSTSSRRAGFSTCFSCGFYSSSACR